MTDVPVGAGNDREPHDMMGPCDRCGGYTRQACPWKHDDCPLLTALPGAGGGHTCACGHAHEMEVGCSICSCDLWTRPKSGGGHTADSEPRPFDPPLDNPILFALERNDCDCDVCVRAKAEALRDVARLEAAANRTAEAELSERERMAGWQTAERLLAAAEAERDFAVERGYAAQEKRVAAEAERDAAHAALRGLLEDDDLPYPPDGDTRFCSMCKAVRVARAVLGGPE